jgi:ribosomal peptide maturation radical SAM protein 1
MKIALLSLPFLSPQYPALGLTQIKARLKEIFKESVDVRLLYLNHDFYRYFGSELYTIIGESGFAFLLKEWVFRTEAFDHIKPNLDEYFRRFFPGIPTGSPMIALLKTKLVNLGAFIGQVISTYGLTSFDVIGVNAMFAVVPGLAICRHVKKRNPRIITIMGGAAVFKDMGEVLIRHYPHLLDYVCCGPGLISFPRLIRAIMENNDPARDAIDGIFSGTNSGKVGDVSEEFDINQDIPLDYDDFFESFRRLQPGQAMQPIILMETSRGCSWRNCTFCGLNKEGLKYRVKRPGTAVEEIDRYVKKYNCHIEMVDNVMPRGYIKHVFPYLRVPEGKFLMYEVRGDYNEEEMKALNRARVKMIQPGIESLSTPVLELMNKGTTAFQCIDMLKLCVKYGILAGWNLLIGFPGMTAGMYEDLIAIIPRVAHLFPPGAMNPLRIDRFSAYWQNSEKYDLVLAPFTAYEYVYPFDRDVLAKIAYHFEDRNFESERYRLLAAYYKKLDAPVKAWQRRWQTRDARHFPRLTCRDKEDGTYIYDSRGESVNEYKISPLAAEILNMLETPLAADALMTHFPGETGERIREVLQHLDSEGLVFKENDRWMSLVIRDYSEEEIKFIVETCNYQVQ